VGLLELPGADGSGLFALGEARLAQVDVMSSGGRFSFALAQDALGAFRLAGAIGGCALDVVEIAAPLFEQLLAYGVYPFTLGDVAFPVLEITKAAGLRFQVQASELGCPLRGRCVALGGRCAAAADAADRERGGRCKQSSEGGGQDGLPGKTSSGRAGGRLVAKTWATCLSVTLKLPLNRLRILPPSLSTTVPL
jgi:hypothetical protein